jgi:hypothetical protein
MPGTNDQLQTNAAIQHHELIAGAGHLQVQGSKIAAVVKSVPELLLDQARGLVNQNNLDSLRLAVVLAHSACDVQTESAMYSLLARANPDEVVRAIIGSWGRPLSMSNTRVRELYSALTEDNQIAAALWWRDWTGSRTLRHEVAHKGAQVDQQQGQRAVAVCEEYVKRLRDEVAKTPSK